MATRRAARIGGRTISYLEADTRTAQPGGRSRGSLVLIHAFPLSAEMWASQLDALPPGWHAIAPDLRGFGRSEGDRAASGDGLTMNDYAGDVIDLLGHLGIHDAVIGGLSMGGYVAFALFRHVPSLFAGMMLADTRPQTDTDETRAGRRAMLDLVAREGAAGVATAMLPKLLGETTRRERPEVERHVRELILANPAAGIAGAIARMMTRPDSTAQLAAIRCPTLIVAGDEDALTPVAEARRTHEAIRGSVLEVVATAGHLSNLERPDAFNAALARFLSHKV